jgi:hypothetical protein
MMDDACDARLLCDNVDVVNCEGYRTVDPKSRGCARARYSDCTLAAFAGLLVFQYYA